MSTKNPATPVSDHDQPVRFVDNYLTYLLNRTSHLISDEFYQTLAERDVPLMHWRVLVTLFDGPMHMTDLAQIVLEKQPTMSKIIDRMEKLDLVRRDTGITDRRSTLVSIRPDGMEVVRPLLQLAKQQEARVMSTLDDTEATMLIGVLQKLIALHRR